MNGKNIGEAIGATPFEVALVSGFSSTKSFDVRERISNVWIVRWLMWRRHIGDAVKAKGFKGGRKYDIRERIFYFTVKTIPIPKLAIEINRISEIKYHVTIIILV
jgi:hypothetical protein